MKTTKVFVVAALAVLLSASGLLAQTPEQSPAPAVDPQSSTSIEDVKKSLDENASKMNRLDALIQEYNQKAKADKAESGERYEKEIKILKDQRDEIKTQGVQLKDALEKAIALNAEQREADRIRNLIYLVAGGVAIVLVMLVCSWLIKEETDKNRVEHNKKLGGLAEEIMKQSTAATEQIEGLRTEIKEATAQVQAPVQPAKKHLEDPGVTIEALEEFLKIHGGTEAPYILKIPPKGTQYDGVEFPCRLELRPAVSGKKPLPFVHFHGEQRPVLFDKRYQKAIEIEQANEKLREDARITKL